LEPCRTVVVVDADDPLDPFGSATAGDDEARWRAVAGAQRATLVPDREVEVSEVADGEAAAVANRSCPGLMKPMLRDLFASGMSCRYQSSSSTLTSRSNSAA
jgi:hypothetical protein